MKIGIIGSGNIGTALAVDLARRHQVRLHSSRPERFSGELTYKDSSGEGEFRARLELVSRKYEDVLANAEIVFVCLPTFLIRSASEQIALALNAPVPICFVPGAGGVEFLSRRLVDRGCPILGLDRVPYVARLVEYGKTVSANKKKSARMAFFRNASTELFETVSNLLDMPMARMRSFISMSLTPTLHVSRLYDLYGDMDHVGTVSGNPLFYAEWRDSASLICLEVDRELHDVCNAISRLGIDTSEVIPYTTHYEVGSYRELTRKLRSIQSLSGIYGPVVKKENEFALDIDSRYFTESFPFRLALVKGLADIADVSIPLSSKILTWYSRLANKDYFREGRFCGEDAKECCCPQNFGIHDVPSLMSYYLN